MKRGKKKVLYQSVLIIGWITGVIASTVLMQQNNVDTKITLNNIFYLIIISLAGLSYRFEDIDDILEAPLWLTFSTGILAGVIGRLISLYITNPWLILEIASNFNIK